MPVLGKVENTVFFTMMGLRVNLGKKIRRYLSAAHMKINDIPEKKEERTMTVKRTKNKKKKKRGKKERKKGK